MTIEPWMFKRADELIAEKQRKLKQQGINTGPLAEAIGREAFAEYIGQHEEKPFDQNEADATLLKEFLRRQTSVMTSEERFALDRQIYRIPR